MSDKVAQQTWRPDADLRPDLAEVVAALGAENMRWVGGAVRDGLLGVAPQDFDAATPLSPQEVTDRCKAAGIRIIPTGIDHGTVTAILAHGPVEITTLRKDVSTDGRRATVEFAQDWRQDAARRDFTFNALFAHPETGAVSDYFGGMEDLAARRVRFIGDADARIAEDHLRILRYYRFQARFGAQLDAEAERACTQNAAKLKGLSRERVAQEMLSLVSLPDPHETLSRMFAQNVLQVVLPECSQLQLAQFAQLVSAERAQNIAPAKIRRLAALLPASAEVAGNVASRFRLSRAQRKRLVCIARRSEENVQADRQALPEQPVPPERPDPPERSDPPERPDPPERSDPPERPDPPERSDPPERPDPPERSDPPERPDPPEQTDQSIFTLAYRVGRDCAIDRLLMQGASAQILLEWEAPQLPLKGGEIVQRGVDAGPKVAAILQTVEARWVQEGFPNRTRVEQILTEELAKNSQL